MYSVKKNIDIIIKNGIVVTVDDKNTIIKNGAVAVKNSKIIDVGTNKQILDKYFSKRTIDAKGKIVMPGFVNAHTHLAMTIFRGMVDDTVLSDWLYKYIFPAEQKCINPQTVKIGAELSMLEMVHSGTTCFNDMYYYQDVTAEVAKNFGMRGIINEGLIDFPVANSKNPQEGLDYSKMLLKKYANDDLISVGLGAHSCFSCSEDLLKDAHKLAVDNKTIFHIHVAESEWELKTTIKKFGLTPVQYLNKLGLLTQNSVFAHGVWLNDIDISLLVEKNVGIVHNPECNMKISSGIAPIPKLLDKGVKIGLGTDGVASNNNLSMIQELHTMALLHKVNSMNPTVIPAEQAVRIATMGSAKVLGKDKEIGSIEIGKNADIIIIDTKNAHTTPIYNVYSIIAYSLYGNEVTDVIINGKEIMIDNEILTIDESRVINDAKNVSEKIKKDIL